MKEDIHFKVLDNETWNYLFQIYGGVDVPRLSIALPSDTGRNDHIVEINLRRFKIVTFPRVKYLPGT